MNHFLAYLDPEILAKRIHPRAKEYKDTVVNNLYNKTYNVALNNIENIIGTYKNKKKKESALKRLSRFENKYLKTLL